LRVKSRLAAASLTLAWLAALPAWAGTPCSSDAECGAAEHCYGAESCGEGVCTPAFVLDRFPLESVAADAYAANLIGVLDHDGELFYTQCCDSRITAYTGESVDRGPGATCPESIGFPACLVQLCTCAYRDPDFEPFVINGNYVAASLLFYDGHAGYDYPYGFGTPIVAPRAGRLCKAENDPINGHVGVATAWDKFHTFYIDHGLAGGAGWSTWYLHASNLEGESTSGAPLSELLPGECADVAVGQAVATVGNFGTLAPHLHFEVRRYDADDGPEARSARVVDPYGWSGSGPDPLAENAWAHAMDEPLWVGCGNGRVECGEQCDDGNLVADDGCSPTCELDPLLQCLDELEGLRSELAECRDAPLVPDSDGDGESDATDRCAETPTDVDVDDSGCSQQQFCSATPTRGIRGWFRCFAADWRNDRPLLRWPGDCRARRLGGRCVASD
jgi:cysteine-rich repeat protein